jgi:predicted alpha/beta hydrolase family esterase
MVKRAFLIHGWEGHPEEGWRPWLRDRLEESEFDVFVPAMPDTNHPKMNTWIDHLSRIVGEPDENCYFVGHSLGCIAILRYLETLRQDQMVGGAILVAGFSQKLKIDEIKNFFLRPVEWEKIRSHCSKFVAIHSDNDPYVPLWYGDIFKDKLGAKLIIQHDMKHFSGSDGITRLPVAFDSLLEMSKS